MHDIVRTDTISWQDLQNLRVTVDTFANGTVAPRISIGPNGVRDTPTHQQSYRVDVPVYPAAPVAFAPMESMIRSRLVQNFDPERILWVHNTPDFTDGTDEGSVVPLVGWPIGPAYDTYETSSGDALYAIYMDAETDNSIGIGSIVEDVYDA